MANVPWPDGPRSGSQPRQVGRPPMRGRVPKDELSKTLRGPPKTTGRFPMRTTGHFAHDCPQRRLQIQRARVTAGPNNTCPR